MRLGSVLIVLGLALGSTGSALARSPGGSTEADGEVTCNRRAGLYGATVNVGAATPDASGGGNWLFVGTTGAEFCSDDSIPLDGRIILSMQDGYLAADGDNSNEPIGLQGCVRSPGGQGPAQFPIGCGPDGDSSA